MAISSVWKRILKWIVWSVGGLVSLVVVAYLALLAINWRDRPPSETALRFAAMYRDRPPLADAENAYVHVMRLDANGKSSADRGRKIFPGACLFGTRECAMALEGNEKSIREWLESEQALLDSYRTLLQLPGWLESVPHDVDAALPSYSSVMNGQKLLLANAYFLTEQKDASGIRELLTSDVRFWRRVLASSDTLITKMIAVAALNRHFGVGNLILRKLPAALQGAAMPEEWRVSITEEERSLLRAFVGEWVYGQSLLRQSVQSGTWQDRFMVLLFQQQDTDNRRAEMLARAVDEMNVPFAQLPLVQARLQLEFDEPVVAAGLTDWLYNPAGKALLVIASHGFAPYGARVADIEGGRRAALLAVELRSQSVPADKVSPALGLSAIRSPYDNLPFLWDDKERSIVFMGLQKGDRARQSFMY